MCLNELPFIFVVLRKLVLNQNQLSEGKFALLSGEELLEFANNTLTITDEDEFLKVESQEQVHFFLEASVALIMQMCFSLPGC